MSAVLPILPFLFKSQHQKSEQNLTIFIGSDETSLHNKLVCFVSEKYIYANRVQKVLFKAPTFDS